MWGNPHGGYTEWSSDQEIDGQEGAYSLTWAVNYRMKVRQSDGQEGTYSLTWAVNYRMKVRQSAVLHVP